MRLLGLLAQVAAIFSTVNLIQGPLQGLQGVVGRVENVENAISISNFLLVTRYKV